MRIPPTGQVRKTRFEKRQKCPGRELLEVDSVARNLDIHFSAETESLYTNSFSSRASLGGTSA